MADTTADERLRAIGVAIALTFGAFLVGNVLVVTVALALENVGVPILSRPSRRLLLSTVLLQGIAFGGTALVYLRVGGLGIDFVRVRVPTRQDLAVAFAGFVGLLGILAVATLLLAYFGIDSAENQVIDLGRQEPLVFLLLVPLSFLLVGPGEELLFRALVQGTLVESFRTARGIVLASALFAVVHVFALSGEGKAVYVGVIFVLALILGAIYEYTDNLVVPALVHGAYNALQFGLAYLQAIGRL